MVLAACGLERTAPKPPMQPHLLSKEGPAFVNKPVMYIQIQVAGSPKERNSFR
jgi:hypothetical protein